MTRLSIAGVALLAASCGYVRPAIVHAARLGSPVSVGVNADITWGIPRSSVLKEVSLMHAAGISWVRATVYLSGVEPSPGRISWPYMRQIDTAVRAAHAAGVRVLLEVDRTPYWASADPRKYTDRSGQHWNDYWTYSNPNDYARIVRFLVKHYRRVGGVGAYELWSEPNWPAFWPSGVSAAAYVKLLRAAYPVIKRLDPKATVLMGGLSDIRAYPYLEALYRAGARSYYDEANFHIYPGGDPNHCAKGSGGRPVTSSFCALDVLRSEMTAHGDHKHVWVTEIGWSTCVNHPPCVSPQSQARYIATAFKLLGDRHYGYVDKAFVYTLRDLKKSNSDVTWGGSLGIVTRDLVPKPAYYALRTFGLAARAAMHAHTHRKR